MAITFVPCKDKEHAIACREMDLLYLNFGSDEEPDWELAYGLNTQWVEEAYGDGNDINWPPAHFSIALED